VKIDRRCLLIGMACAALVGGVKDEGSGLGPQMATPTDAFDHPSRLGVDAFLDMQTAMLWRGAKML
jgi:hypothetical protein